MNKEVISITSIVNEEYKSKIYVTESFCIMSKKNYSWFKKLMWKIFFNIEIKDIKEWNNE